MESALGKPVEWVCGNIVIPFGYTYATEREEGMLWTNRCTKDKWSMAAVDNSPLIEGFTYIVPIKQQEVEHPPHYGGEQDPYEAIKVIEAWKLGFNLGNLLKYVCRAGKKDNRLKDLKKALWYLQREITLEEQNEANKT